MFQVKMGKKRTLLGRKKYNNEFTIYKVDTKCDESRYLFDSFFNEKIIDPNMLNNIKDNNEFAKNIGKNNNNFVFCYYVINNQNEVVCRFEHDYNLQSKKMILSEADTCPKYAGKGIGSSVYKEIQRDIYDTFKIDTITSYFCSDSGRKFGKKTGFHIYSGFGCLTAIINPNVTAKKKTNKNLGCFRIDNIKEQQL